MENRKIKKYSNDEITIVWEAEKCIHSAVCVKVLPKVYNPKARPWIKIENAQTKDLIHQINQCPSGALSYDLNNSINQNKPNNMSTKIEVMKNGPLLVTGELEIIDEFGNVEKKEKRTAFCRCGHSSKQPFCDGTHKTTSFGV